MAVVAALTIVTSCHTPKDDTVHTPIEADGVLSLAVGTYTPGNMVIAGERYGYLHEIVGHFAGSKTLGISLSEKVPVQTLIEGLADGTIEVAALPATLTENYLPTLTAEPYMEAKYVIISRKGEHSTITSDEELTRLLADKDILVDASLTDSRLYDRLLDENPDARFHTSSVSGYYTPCALSNDEWDLAICQHTDAAVAMAVRNNLNAIYTFEEQEVMTLVFANAEAAEQFRRWKREFERTAEHASLAYLYNEHGLIGDIAALRRSATRVVDGISIWDDLLRRVSESEGVDWRLLSAIAYAESRFTSDIVSKQGAVGLMQVMPSVARQFNVTSEQLANPETNIIVSAKLLKKIDHTLGFASDTTPYDRMAIVLAAYNGGVGRIGQARRLVASEGGNPDSWESVSQTLRLMADPNYIASKGGSVRRFGGSGQTLAYVAQVIGRYNIYCEAVK